MTTQHELAMAFFNREDTPKRASNMRVKWCDGKRWILGGPGGGHYPLAVELPIGEFYIWNMAPRSVVDRYNRFYYSSRCNQRDVVNRAAHELGQRTPDYPYEIRKFHGGAHNLLPDNYYNEIDTTNIDNVLPHIDMGAEEFRTL